MKKNKPVIIFGIIIFALLILVFSGAVILGKYIEREIENRQIGTYIIQSREVNVNIFVRSISIKEVVAEDSAANQKFIVPEIKATGIRIFPLIFNNELIINKLLIQQPKITILQTDSVEKVRQEADTTMKRDRNTEQIQIKQLDIADAVFSLQQQDSGVTDTLLSLKAGLKLWNLNIFSDEEQLTFENHSAEKLQVTIYNLRYDVPGGLYRLQFEKLFYSSEEQTLSLGNFHLSSLLSKYDIAKKTGVQTEWYDIVLKQFEMEGINLGALLHDSAVVFRSAVMVEPEATIFRDKRLPFPDKPDTKLPMDMLKSLPVAVHSDSILIKNASVVYEEHAEESTESGRVTFNRLYATVYNLGTIQDSIDGQTAISARAVLMNESLLNMEFVFPNSEQSNQYRVTGSLEPMRMAVLNPMLVPSVFVRVNEGQIKSLDFDFTYHENNSRGSLDFQYENLDISLLDKEDGSQKKIKTFLTETFVLNKENLKEKNSYQEGTISVERDKKRSVFNYWWKSLFSGIKDVLAF